MSFDIFLQCFRKGQPATFKREIFEDIFLPHCADLKGYRSDPKFMRAEFPDGGGSDIHSGNDYDVLRMQLEHGELPAGTDIGVDDKSIIDHMMFNHCGGDMFFQALYELANRTQSVILWPSEGPSTVVTNEAVLKELPEKGFDLATIKIVHSGADIVEAIQNS